MSVERIILCLIAPPLSVVGRSLNDFILVAFFTVLGWVPGVMVALGMAYYDWYTARQHAQQAQTLDAMHDSLRSREQMANIPAGYRSGADRLERAVRGQRLVEQQKREQERSRRIHPHV